ncbi:hypothetical protein PENDEC_c065G04098 [Penicillium decumbens]|uniref:6-phosphogluconate dehydrogenase, decarboxylating n=1 Tax=Penicillium decumbens TaxID=69771 RepID=A0A1V6NNN1_PENDC|nr:hypothetical protein PENDEC_c065G04098 [Penicillium decumbens]
MSNTPDAVKQFKRIGVVGAGNMGSMMAFAFSEIGLDVSIWDVKRENVDSFAKQLQQAKGLKGEIEPIHDVDEFMRSLDGQGERKLFIFSITHGYPADSVLSQIKQDLKKGDIILDGGNEHYRNTERRQKECEEIGVSWIGMGVSGGYQSARHGPSMSPGGDPDSLDGVVPLLELYAAKDPKTGMPCVMNMGPRGAGHYVKMIHNGIEVGMMSAICEAWSFLSSGLGLSYDEIGNIFAKWNDSGEMRTTYLLNLAADICRTTKSSQGEQKGEGASNVDGYVLDDILDKVVQDDDSSEGTPTWSIIESASRHVSAPTLASGLYFRIASGNRAERLKVAQKIGMPTPNSVTGIKEREAIIEQLRRAVYCVFLSSFCQGLEIISRASIEEEWNIDLAKCIQIWRAGCIIQSEYIADMFQPLLNKEENHQLTNMKLLDRVAQELQQNYAAIKHVVATGASFDHYLPAISSTLEYMKYVGGAKLPTQFMEAEMDYFGAHSYNKPGVPGEDPGPTAKGSHHYEWKPA